MLKLTLSLLLLISIQTSFAGDGSDRVRSKIEFIKSNVNFGFRKFYQVKIVDADEANAYSVGSVTLVSQKMLDILDDNELMAVIAHEMAHREKYHIFSRSGMMIGGAIAAFLDWHSDLPYSERLNGFNEDYRLEQELQADCYAYNWLLQLKNKGFPFEPEDLNRASTKVFGMDFGDVDPTYFEDHPGYIRYHQIKRGHPKNCE